MRYNYWMILVLTALAVITINLNPASAEEGDCVPEVCDDGIDNDCDDGIDTSDQDCWPVPADRRDTATTRTPSASVGTIHDTASSGNPRDEVQVMDAPVDDNDSAAARPGRSVEPCDGRPVNVDVQFSQQHPCKTAADFAQVENADDIPFYCDPGEGWTADITVNVSATYGVIPDEPKLKCEEDFQKEKVLEPGGRLDKGLEVLQDKGYPVDNRDIFTIHEAPGTDGAKVTVRWMYTPPDPPDPEPAISCWDLNENGEKDFPEEDVNGPDGYPDGVIDVHDCTEVKYVDRTEYITGPVGFNKLSAGIGVNGNNLSGHLDWFGRYNGVLYPAVRVSIMFDEKEHVFHWGGFLEFGPAVRGYLPNPSADRRDRNVMASLGGGFKVGWEFLPQEMVSPIIDIAPIALTSGGWTGDNFVKDFFWGAQIQPAIRVGRFNFGFDLRLSYPDPKELAKDDYFYRWGLGGYVMVDLFTWRDLSGNPEE